MCETDVACIRSCLDGHPEQFRLLVGRYQAGLLAYLSGRLGDREQADEVLQETFVRAYFALNKLRKPEAFFAWLRGIADHVIKKHQWESRRQREAARLYRREQHDPAVSQNLNLERAVSALPETYRQVVLLRYYGGWPCTKVAEALGVPIGTVTKRLSRAYALLRESLRESEDRPAESEVSS